MMALDCVMPHLHVGASQPEGHSSTWKRTTLLIFAVTLHNIPEGMAVGFSFALAAQHGGDPALYAGAMALAIGMGIQNFPEGRGHFPSLAGRRVCPPGKAFLYGGLFRRCGAGFRHSGGAGGREHPALAALAAGLCRRAP